MKQAKKVIKKKKTGLTSQEFLDQNPSMMGVLEKLSMDFTEQVRQTVAASSKVSVDVSVGFRFYQEGQEG
jgi:hypothetical protein